MTRGVRKGKVTISILKERIGWDEKKLKEFIGLGEKEVPKLIDLLRIAHSKNLITPEELDLSIPTSTSAIKCYLYSIVSDETIRQKIEQYVIASSKLYVRGSFIANLLAIDAFGPILHGNVPKFTFHETIDFFSFVEDDNIFKQCFLPERWPVDEALAQEQENTEARKRLCRDVRIQRVLETHSQVFANLLPNWLNVMKVSGWDNSLNRMYSKYRANIQNHVTVHFPKHLKNYLQLVNFDPGSFRPGLLNNIYKPLSPIIAHNDDFEFAMKLRTYFGPVKINSYNNPEYEYNEKLFSFFIFLVKHGVTEGTYLPLSKVGRKYAYLDEKITRFLLPTLYSKVKEAEGHAPSIMELFGISPVSFRNKRKQIRKGLRKKKHPDKRRMDKSRKERNLRSILKKKWRLLGCSNMPQNARIQSFETDGVGMSICIQRPLPLYKKQEEAEELFEKPVFVGIDQGRAKISVSAISSDPIKKPETVAYTRREYYYHIKHRIRMKWERVRQIQNPVANILSQNGTENIVNYITTVSNNIEALENEYLQDKERALWKMRLYRFKKRSLDNAVNKVIQKHKNRPIVIGIGDATFAPTGRGEKAVPTNQFVKALQKGLRRINRKSKLLSIPEFRTTLCCCACGQITTQPQTMYGQRSRRLRLCTCCDETNAKIRDRDVQGARNILWLTQYMYYGAERPSYMCRTTTRAQLLERPPVNPVT